MSANVPSSDECPPACGCASSVAEPEAAPRGEAPGDGKHTSRFRVVEGCCAGCAGDVSGALGRLPGVLNVDVLAAAGMIRVEHDGTTVARDVQREAARFGLKLADADRVARSARVSPWKQPKFLALATATALLVAGLVAEHILRTSGPFVIGLYMATVLIGGFYPARSGWRALRTRRLTIHSLLVAATTGAVILGVFEEAALLVVVFSLGEVLEDYVADKARGAIRALMALAPPTAQRIRGEELETLAVQELSIGDVVLVRPGERLPTDGEVVEGRSAIDQSPVTGESIPVEVHIRATVFGGTLNGMGALKVRVTKAYADTVLARIVRQVEEAQASKSRAQRFADRFGALYTPAMFLVAATVAVLPPVFGGDLWQWFYRAMVVLTVSCSCALVLSVPVAVVAAVSRAAREGILIKGGTFLDALASVRVLAFDKTGTLTQGRPSVTTILPFGGASHAEALRLAAAVEAGSEHPLASAILSEARRQGIAWPTATGVHAIAGVGVEASVEGHDVFVGRPNNGSSMPEVATDAARLETEGKTVVVVLRDGTPLALLAIADELRAPARDVVLALRKLGLQRITMLTGDNERTAAAIAGAAALDAWHAGLMPEDKTSAVQKLRREFGPVAMVGDGVNDAPALAAADIGIAMGAAGTDVALETADVALMADDLEKLPIAIELARNAVANLQQNVFMSLAAVAVLVPAALLGVFSLTTGLLANEATALLVILNGLRLLAPGRRQARATTAGIPVEASP